MKKIIVAGLLVLSLAAVVAGPVASTHKANACHLYCITDGECVCR